MRVLHVYRHFHPDYTGDGIYYGRLIPRMEEYGTNHEILAVQTAHPAGLVEDTYQGIKVHYLRTGVNFSTTLALLFWCRANLHSFDILHIHSHVDRYFLTYFLARLYGKHVVFSASLEDSAADLILGYRPIFRWVVRQLIRTISKFIVISPRLLSRSLTAVSRNQVQLIPQGIELGHEEPTAAKVAEMRAAYNFSPDDILLLTVGSICERKNMLQLVRALSKIPNPSVKLLIVGPILEEDYGRQLTTSIADLDLQDRVFLLGFQFDPSPFYSMSDIFVFASTSEGFPNVFLEAMANRLPIVSNYLPGLVDFVVQYGKTGYFTSSDSQLVEQIVSLVDDPERRIAMGNSAHAMAVENFSLTTIAKMYVDMYNSLNAGQLPPVLENRPPGFDVQLCHDIHAPGIKLTPIVAPPEWPPLLNIVVDMGSEFDLRNSPVADVLRPIDISELSRFLEVIAEFGAKACLVADYPTINDVEGAKVIQKLFNEGHDIGVLLQTSSTPPIVGIQDDWHSFSGNLGPAFEAEKLRRHSQKLQAITGSRPIIFKAGRHGVSPSTWRTLIDNGFKIDLSVMPHFDFSRFGGPDFTRYDSRPSWIGSSRELLELPTTAGLCGYMAPLLRHAGSPSARRWKLGRLLRSVHALRPKRLSPEDMSFHELRALTNFLYRNGTRVFTLNLQCSSLNAGTPPHAKSEGEIRQMLNEIRRYFKYFEGEISGTFTQPTIVLPKLLGLREAEEN